MQHKIRVCVFVLAILGIVVHWWQNERTRTRINLAPDVTFVAAGSDAPESGSTPSGGQRPTLEGVGPSPSANAASATSAGAPAAPRPAGGGGGRGSQGSVVIEGGAARAPGAAGDARPASTPPAVPRPGPASYGGIAGTVRAASGAALSGVAVRVSGDALSGGVRTTSTDGSGTFRLSNLPAGTYTVTFERAGYEPVTRRGVRVRSAAVTEGVQGVLTPSAER